MAQALLHEPDVLIMDEPTAGLDPNQIRGVRATLRRLSETKTILLSTAHLARSRGDGRSRRDDQRRTLSLRRSVEGLRNAGKDLDDAFYLR